MRLVLDCNVIISAGLTDGISRRALSLASFSHDILVSDEMERELRNVITRPMFADHAQSLRQLTENILKLSIRVKGAAYPYGLPDPDDEIYLSAALAARADFIITGNKRHFPKNVCESVRVVTPREFLEIAE